MDLANTPALAPPQGVEPNFANPVTRAYAFIITSTIFLALMMTVFTLRMYVNIWIRRNFGADDGRCHADRADILLY